MSRLLRGLRSLRWRLTLTYVALLALLLAALGAYQYETLQHSLVTTRVAQLRADVGDAETLLASELTAAARPRATPTPAPGSTGTAAPARPESAVLRAATVLCLRDGTQVRRSAARAALLLQALACAVSDASGHTVAVLVYDRALVTVAQAGGVPEGSIPRLDPAALEDVVAGGPSPAEVLDATSGPQLVTAFPLRAVGGTAVTGEPVRAVAQLSTSTSSIDSVLTSERQRVGGGAAAVLVLALLAGLLLTGRALAPLRRLTQTANRLAEGDLRARSRLAPRGDETGTLARAFDDMADRIEEAFALQAESEARMRRFIADASHELRTPVTALKGYVDVIQRGAVSDPAALRAALGAIGREAERMRLLVLDLLTLARLDAHRPLEPRPLDLGEVVSSILDDGVPGMPERVTRQLADGPLVVEADRTALVTVLRNLLVNACKYAPGAAQTWSTERLPDRAVVRVRDEGPGIPASDLPHVFERFYRGEKTRAREEGGSGLGLSIVQGLTRAMGGDVAIESEEGLGTTVTVWLPLAAAREDTAAAA